MYLGGKAKIATKIVAAIRADGGARPGYRVWEPFCGGLGATMALATLGPVICSDANPALISLYRAVQSGWVPQPVTEDDYRAARNLPDTDPRKAFAGYACSFGGKWFGGYARARRGTDYAAVAQRAIARQVPSAHSFDCWSFLDVEPQPLPIVIYCDPPYAGTTGYSAVGAFDHPAFWARAEQWARLDVPVYVSEFTAPPAWRCIWESARGTSGGAALRTKSARVHVERLFTWGQR
jgi:DNA adenine methylase